MRHVRPIHGEGSPIVFESFADAEAIARRHVMQNGRSNRNVCCGGDMVAWNPIVQDSMVVGNDAGQGGGVLEDMRGTVMRHHVAREIAVHEMAEGNKWKMICGKAERKT